MLRIILALTTVLTIACSTEYQAPVEYQDPPVITDMELPEGHYDIVVQESEIVAAEGDYDCRHPLTAGETVRVNYEDPAIASFNTCTASSKHVSCEWYIVIHFDGGHQIFDVVTEATPTGDITTTVTSPSTYCEWHSWGKVL